MGEQGRLSRQEASEATRAQERRIGVKSRARCRASRALKVEAEVDRREAKHRRRANREARRRKAGVRHNRVS